MDGDKGNAEKASDGGWHHRLPLGYKGSLPSLDPMPPGSDTKYSTADPAEHSRPGGTQLNHRREACRVFYARHAPRKQESERPHVLRAPSPSKHDGVRTAPTDTSVSSIRVVQTSTANSRQPSAQSGVFLRDPQEFLFTKRVPRR